MKTLLLVDGSSYLYRAFHALPDLRNPAGEPTGAIYGVLNMLRRLRKGLQPPDYSAVRVRRQGQDLPRRLVPRVQGHRPPMPDDLARQIEPLHEAASAPRAGRC